MTRRFNIVLIAVILFGALFGGVFGDRVLATDTEEKRAIERFAHLVDVVESSYPEDIESDAVVRFHAADGRRFAALSESNGNQRRKLSMNSR